MFVYKVLCLLYILVSFATSTAASKSYFCGSGYSERREFKCLQGPNCVEKDNICDGIKDCDDGSDEATCISKEPPKSTGTRLTCVLPPYPAHGTYEVLIGDKTNVEPGQEVQSVLLRVRCEQGYGMLEAGHDMDSNKTLDVHCIDGVWSHTINKCVRFCKLDPNPSVRYMCLGTVCKNYVAPGISVIPICEDYYNSDSLLYMKCKAGTWNYVAHCKAGCGQLTPKGVQLIIDGKPAKRGELPWHVGIYRKLTEFEQICGGSLVSEKVVISAAHCFWTDVRKLLPPANFAVAIGKLYRPWNDMRDQDDVQKSDVEEIRVPNLFLGGSAHYQEDIALVILVNTFVYKAFVRPVCLNFDGIFDTLQLQHGNLGKVAGWGLNSANGQIADVLKTVEMPYISEGTCVNALPPSFRPYITGDKFCAGYTNGTALCKGDSGGGIVFPERQHGVDRYYLRGIVSTAPIIDDQLCNDKTYTTFTRIRRHEDLIKNALVDVVAAKSCSLGMVHCEDGTCQDQETDCGERR